MEEKDEIGMRLITIDTDQFEVKAHDPYGFWTVRVKNGKKTPPELQGHFTSVSEAERHIRAYSAKLRGGDPSEKKLTIRDPKVDKANAF